MVLIVEKCQHEHKQSVANTKFEPDGQIVFSSAPEIINRWIFFAFVCFWLLIFLAFSFLFFCLVRGEKKKSLAHGILVGNQREKTILGRGPLSFFFRSFGDNSVLFRYCPVQRPLCIFLLFFLRSPIRGFLSFFFFVFFFFFFFLLSPILWLGISFLFFFAFSLIGNFLSFLFCFLFDWKFSFFSFLLPRVRIDILTLGQGLWWVRILAQGL